VTQIFALVVRQSAVSLLVGIVAGCGVALAIGRVAANLLFQVRASDPLVLVSVVALVASVGLAASATAVRHGLRIDPASALRDE